MLCRVSLSSTLCFLSDFCNTLCGQEEKVEFINILKGKGRALLNIASQRMPQAVLNWVCLFIAHVQCLVDRDGDLLSPCIMGGGGTFFPAMIFWFLSGLPRAENGSIHTHFFFCSLSSAWGVFGETRGARYGRWFWVGLTSRSDWYLHVTVFFCNTASRGHFLPLQHNPSAAICRL